MFAALVIQRKTLAKHPKIFVPLVITEIDGRSSPTPFLICLQ